MRCISKRWALTSLSSPRNAVAPQERSMKSSTANVRFPLTLLLCSKGFLEQRQKCGFASKPNTIYGWLARGLPEGEKESNQCSISPTACPKVLHMTQFGPPRTCGKGLNAYKFDVFGPLNPSQLQLHLDHLLHRGSGSKGAGVRNYEDI